MYGPSFITGRLIGRFGAPAVVAMGLALIAGAAATGLAGIDVGHFWLALILLGVGWNFGFVGASTLILECHGPEEKAKVQSLNDFVVFGAMVIGSFASGNLLTSYGWRAVCLVTLPPLTVAGAMLGWSSLSSRRARMSETPKGI
ncbi:Arabinose efflux permease OS=Afipia felis OX=1035 GN=NCTC12722_02991 PE=4 SV=1 [Afipia felis]